MRNFLFSWDSGNQWVYSAHLLQYVYINSSSVQQENKILHLHNLDPGTNGILFFFFVQRSQASARDIVVKRKINE